MKDEGGRMGPSLLILHPTAFILCLVDLERRLEAVAAADGGDLEVQRRVAGVPALVDHVVGRLLLRPHLHELLVVGVVLAEMAAQAALAFVNLHHHGGSPFAGPPGQHAKQSACRANGNSV